MRAANYKLDLPRTMELVPLTKQTLWNLVNRNSNPHLTTEENLQKSQEGMAYLHSHLMGFPPFEKGGV